MITDFAREFFAIAKVKGVERDPGEIQKHSVQCSTNYSIISSPQSSFQFTIAPVNIANFVVCLQSLSILLRGQSLQQFLLR